MGQLMRHRLPSNMTQYGWPLSPDEPPHASVHIEQPHFAQSERASRNRTRTPTAPRSRDTGNIAQSSNGSQEPIRPSVVPQAETSGTTASAGQQQHQHVGNSASRNRTRTPTAHRSGGSNDVVHRNTGSQEPMRQAMVHRNRGVHSSIPSFVTSGSRPPDEQTSRAQPVPRRHAQPLVAPVQRHTPQQEDPLQSPQVD